MAGHVEGTLGFKLHREYIDFLFCSILGQAMKE